MKTGPKVGSRNAPPRRVEVRCFNAMAMWWRVYNRPAVLAPIIVSVRP
jgi:hypothetical protein